MIYYQKTKEIKGNGMQLLAAGFLSLYFATFAQGMDDKKTEEQKIPKSSTEISNYVSEGNQPCLMGLSDEVLLNIFSYLSPGSLVNISEVNCRIWNISYDNKLWEKYIIPASQRTGDLYRSVFKDLYLNPIIFQFYNNSNLTVNFAFGYKCISNDSIIEKMSGVVSLHHNELWTVRKNAFPEDIRNSIQPSHCVLMPRAPHSLLVRTDYKQELPVGFCLEISQEQDFGFTMLAFNKISSLR